MRNQPTPIVSLFNRSTSLLAMASLLSAAQAFVGCATQVDGNASLEGESAEDLSQAPQVEVEVLETRPSGGTVYTHETCTQEDGASHCQSIRLGILRPASNEEFTGGYICLRDRLIESDGSVSENRALCERDLELVITRDAYRARVDGTSFELSKQSKVLSLRLGREVPAQFWSLNGTHAIDANDIETYGAEASMNLGSAIFVTGDEVVRDTAAGRRRYRSELSDETNTISISCGWKRRLFGIASDWNCSLRVIGDLVIGSERPMVQRVIEGDAAFKLFQELPSGGRERDQVSRGYFTENGGLVCRDESRTFRCIARAGEDFETPEYPSR